MTSDSSLEASKEDVIIEPVLDKPLSEIVEESKTALSEEAPKKLKRGRGRPKKSEAKDPEVLSAQTSTPPPPTMIPVLIHGVKVPYQIAASRTGFEGFKLSEEEGQLLATQVDQVLTRYFPNLGEGPSLVAVCALSFAVVSISKYGMYEKWMEENRKESPHHTEESGNSQFDPSRHHQTQPSSSFFPQEPH